MIANGQQQRFAGPRNSPLCGTYTKHKKRTNTHHHHPAPTAAAAARYELQILAWGLWIGGFLAIVPGVGAAWEAYARPAQPSSGAARVGG